MSRCGPEPAECGVTPPPDCGKRAKTLPPMHSYADVVAHYLKTRRGNRPEQRRFADMPDLETAVAAAAACTNAKGKRYSHQRRLPRTALEEAGERLAEADLASCETFDELHERIEEATREIYRFGPLAVYDTAARIGAFLRLEPERVYLHTGSHTGALAIGLGRKKKILEVSDLPSEFHVLTGGEIEDCLCVYKKQLKAIHDA